MNKRTKDNFYLKMFSEALERCGDVFAIYDKDFELVFANTAAFEAMPEYFNALQNQVGVREATRLQLLKYKPHLSGENVKNLTDVMLERLFSGAVYEVGITNNRTLQVTHEFLNDQYTLALGIDVTKIKTQQAEMKTLAKANFDLANIDQLTGLANRRRFIDVLDQKIETHELNGGSFFVGLIDLNGFKRINDLYGHAIGDELLSGVARRSTEYICDTTFIARLGGDEFALISHTDESHLDLLSFSAGLCEALREPQCLSGNDISVSASLGWARYPHDGRTASDLLLKADYALYKSKYSESRKTVVFSDMDETVLRRESDIIVQLENADLDRELSVEFQPIHDVQENRIIGFEALTRWNSTALGPISPLEFIPLAEKIGCISRLTKIILRKALTTAKLWPNAIGLHVNISAIDLGKIDVISELTDIIKASGYPATSVILEVTETAVVETFENMSEVFDLLKESGLRLALDDFGIGFSSLGHLARLPITCLKVDKGFTDRLTPGSDEEKILKTIKFLSDDLGIDCVVEGVEHQSQFDQLTSLGLKHMQGLHFSRSLKPGALGAYILKHALGKSDVKSSTPPEIYSLPAYA